ncbi:unnamed protein product [Ascophyllum nodosum]
MICKEAAHGLAIFCPIILPPLLLATVLSYITGHTSRTPEISKIQGVQYASSARTPILQAARFGEGGGQLDR